MGHRRRHILPPRIPSVHLIGEQGNESVRQLVQFLTNGHETTGNVVGELGGGGTFGQSGHR
jgi:hypothetical protein